MSTLMEDEGKRWTAKRKAALAMEIIQGKSRVAEASRSPIRYRAGAFTRGWIAVVTPS